MYVESSVETCAINYREALRVNHLCKYRKVHALNIPDHKGTRS